MDRIPARSLSDIELPEDLFKADFELTDRYQAFSTELVRLALLGIAGYGFLISEVLVKSGGGPSNLSCLADHSISLGLGVILLGLSAALALAHRFFSTGCLARQIKILRTLKRTENPQWTEQERKIDQDLLKREREDQLRILHICNRVLMASVALLVGGATTVAYVFAAILLSMPSMP
ncbi:MAG: hypothetical protein ACJ76N_20480 [Thermoanaerobaculia bacterium]